MTIFRVIGLLVVLLLGGLSRAQANDLWVIAYDPEFRPLTFQDGQGAAAGLYIEILRSALKQSGIKFRLVPRPWKRLVADTDAGLVDVSVPWRHQEERFRKYHMVGPITADGMPARLWQRKGAGLTWTDYDDLKGLRVGVRAGFTYADAFDKADSFDRVQVFSDDMLIKMLMAGRYDLAISDEATFRDTARFLGLHDDIEPIKGPIIDTTLRYFVVPKSKPEIAERLRETLENHRQSADYTQILQRYFN